MPLKSHARLHPKGVLRMGAMCIHKTLNLCASVPLCENVCLGQLRFLGLLARARDFATACPPSLRESPLARDQRFAVSSPDSVPAASGGALRPSAAMGLLCPRARCPRSQGLRLPTLRTRRGEYFGWPRPRSTPPVGFADSPLSEGACQAAHGQEEGRDGSMSRPQGGRRMNVANVQVLPITKSNSQGRSEGAWDSRLPTLRTRRGRVPTRVRPGHDASAVCLTV